MRKCRVSGVKVSIEMTLDASHPTFDTLTPRHSHSADTRHFDT